MRAQWAKLYSLDDKWMGDFYFSKIFIFIRDSLFF